MRQCSVHLCVSEKRHPAPGGDGGGRGVGTQQQRGAGACLPNRAG